MYKDTDNMHIHIIVNRISLYGNVYDTTFVSNRAARVAEKLSRKYGMTIAKEVKAEKKHQNVNANLTREQTKQKYSKFVIPYSTNTKVQASLGILCFSMN